MVPFALARIPMIGETRGNMAAGGRREVRPLTDSDRQIAGTNGQTPMGGRPLSGGLDVIGSKVTEINVTSPDRVRGNQGANGF